MTDVPPQDPTLEFARHQAIFDPAQVSQEMTLRSRKNSTIILQKINDQTASLTADRMSVSESSLSRWKSSGGLQFAALLLASIGLKVVPVDAVVYIESDDFK